MHRRSKRRSVRGDDVSYLPAHCPGDCWRPFKMTEFDPSSFTLLAKGRVLEEFQPGVRFQHHWGRTLKDADNTLFSAATLAHNPLYFNAEYARSLGHPGVVVNPYLVLCTVVGLSVEDLSEAGGPFLGVDDLTFHRAVYPDDTMTAGSTVVSVRESESRPGFGIVTWHTEGYNQRGELVVEFNRSNLIAKRRSAP